MTANTDMTVTILPELLDFVRPSPHSVFSPSAVERWLGCPYSVNTIKNIPEETSSYAEEGTVAHSVCEAMVRQEFLGLAFPEDLTNKMMGYDMIEMEACARGYVEVIQYWLGHELAIGEVIWWGLEKGIPVFPEDSCFGTADCLIIGTKGALILDYKHGKGKNVAANSLQLMVYAAGLYKHLRNLPDDYTFHTVVYQPRTDMSPKEHSYAQHDLSMFLDEIKRAIEASKLEGLEPVEGNHCYWCPAKRTRDPALKCKAIAEKPLKIAQERFGEFLALTNGKDVAKEKRDAAILKLMSIYPLLKATVEQCEEEIEFRLEKGEHIEGFRIKEKIGRREMPEEKVLVHFLQDNYPGVKSYKVIPETVKPRTITEIEKEIGKNKLDSICVKKVTKEVEVLDEKMRQVLGELSVYGTMINNGATPEEIV